MRDLAELIEHLVADEPVGPPPLTAMLQGRRERRRVRVTLVAACVSVLVIAGAVTALRLGGGATTRGPGPSSSTSTGGTTGRWRQVSTLPLSARHDPVGVWLDGRAYFVGGSTSGEEPTAGPDVRDGAAYDPSTGVWTRISPAPFPLEVGSGFATVADGRIVVRSGRLDQGWATYDPTTDRWRLCSPAPVAVEQPVVASVGSRLYVLDRYDDEAPGPVLVLDIATGTWSTLPNDPFRPRLDDREVVAAGSDVVVLGNNLESAGGRYLPAGVVADVWDGRRWRRVPDAPVAGTDWTFDGHDVVPAVRATRDTGRELAYPTGTLDLATDRWTAHGFGPTQRDSLFGDAVAPVGRLTFANDFVHALGTRSWTTVPNLPEAYTAGRTTVLTPHGLLVLGGKAVPVPRSQTLSMGPQPVAQTPMLWSYRFSSPAGPAH